MSMLSEILATKRTEVARKRERVPLELLQEQLIDAPPLRDFRAALRRRRLPYFGDQGWTRCAGEGGAAVTQRRRVDQLLLQQLQRNALALPRHFRALGRQYLR